jgi:membrane-associated phospholipid phosphatase
MVWGVMVFPIAFHFAESRDQALVWALAYGLLVCLAPILYIGWMVKRGKISDIHMKHRQERTGPFLVSMACTLLAWYVLVQLNAPPVLPLIAAVTLVELAIMAVVSLVWQISMHAMSITVAVVATGIVFGLAPAVVVSPLVPLVGTARLRLHRHTLSQVVAGAFVGALIPIVVLMVM